MTARWLPILLSLCSACGPTATVAPEAPTCPEPTQAAAPEVAPTPEPAAPRVVVFVRHGEKQSTDRDAPLSPAGHTRAACLADALGELGITHVVTSEFVRTRDTAGPLATKLGITPTVLPAADKAKWVEHLGTLPAGSVALVAGHSNTVPDLVAALGAGTVEIAEDTFDKLFAVVVPERGAPTLLRLHYCSTPGVTPSPAAGSMSGKPIKAKPSNAKP